MTLAQQILTFAGTFNGWLILSVFIMLFLGEFSIALPYVLETLWILVGYNVSNGSFTVIHLLELWLIGLFARFLGALTLYSIAGFGRGPLLKVYNRFFGKAIADVVSGTKAGTSLPARFLRRINLLSPFSVAFGRLIWLRVPLTILLSMRRQLRTLLIAVVLFSFVWDGTYLLIGVIGGNIKVSATSIILYSLIGLTFLYSVSFIIQRIFGWASRRNSKTASRL
jgi:hypothetical protein